MNIEKYDDADERKIRIERQVLEWTRSGLLDSAQRKQIAPELEVPSRRTNFFLRLILFVFALLIIAAAFGLFLIEALRAHDDWTMAISYVVAAAGCFILAEVLTGTFALYRFGVEEACAMAGVFFLGLAAGLLVSSQYPVNARELSVLAGLTAAAVGALWVYLRWGYVYAAVASMICLSLTPFQVPMPEFAEHCIAAGMLAVVFAIARWKQKKYGDEFPGDEYGVLQASAWAGIYLFLNLQLSRTHWFFMARVSAYSSVPIVPRPFYWLTYAATWVLPAIGIWLALRDRDRPLLDVNIALALLTLITNKAYLGMTRQTWDPILLGVLLIGVGVFMRRWLSAADRAGFTAAQLLSSDKRRIAVAGAASAFMHAAASPAQESSPHSTFEGGGGRSGGGGASGSF